MGSAALLRESITALQRRSPDELRALLWSDEWLELGLRAFRTRLEDAERDAVRLYFEAIEMVGGAQERALLMVLANLQVKTLDEVRELVTTARQAEGTTLEAATQQAFQLLARRIRTEPGFREDAARTLFGIELAAPASWAVVAEEPTPTEGR